jgi:ABC-type uncharacterized transport system permease subunit
MTGASASSGPSRTLFSQGCGLASVARKSEGIVIPVAALFVGFASFSLFLLVLGKSPVDFFALVYKAEFGSSFSWQNTLSRAAPLLFAALCVALPVRLGLVVIGGEGAIVMGGVASGALAGLLIGVPGWFRITLMALAGAVAGGVWIGAIGALRHYRGGNETFASLLMAYIAIALMNHLVEGPLRDPASMNKPSTAPLTDALRIADVPGFDVHWGLPVGMICCVLAWILMDRTSWGFAARIAGGNVRADRCRACRSGS